MVLAPGRTCILTQHGKKVAALVSKEGLMRTCKHGHRPNMFTLGRGGWLTSAEAAEGIQRLQIDRRIEREVLAKAGLEPVLGGDWTEEVVVVPEVEAKPEVTRRRRWFW